MDYLQEKVSFPDYMFDIKRLVKLGRLSGDNLDISSWWIILDEKLTVSGRMHIVAYTGTDTKR